MYASTIVFALAAATSILAAPAPQAVPPLGTCPTWDGIYGNPGGLNCCVYAGGPTSCCMNNSPNSTYIPEFNYTYLSCQSPWFADINKFYEFNTCNIPGNSGLARCVGVPIVIHY